MASTVLCIHGGGVSHRGKRSSMAARLPEEEEGQQPHADSWVATRPDIDQHEGQGRAQEEQLVGEREPRGY